MLKKEEAQNQYFNELSLRLRAEGIQSEPSSVRTLRVYQDGQPVCDVAYSGDVYREPVPAKGLDPADGYWQLAEFNGVVLAGIRYNKLRKKKTEK